MSIVLVFVYLSYSVRSPENFLILFRRVFNFEDLARGLLIRLYGG